MGAALALGEGVGGRIVQGTRTAPEGSEKGFVYLVYTPTVVAKHLRACFPVAAYKQ